MLYILSHYFLVYKIYNKLVIKYIFYLYMYFVCIEISSYIKSGLDLETLKELETLYANDSLITNCTNGLIIYVFDDQSIIIIKITHINKIIIIIYMLFFYRWNRTIN